MKRKHALVILTFIFCVIILTDTVYASQPSTWAAAEVNEAIALNIVPSALQDQYALPITRAEFCGLMVRLLTVKLAKDIDTILRDNNTQITNVFSDTSDRNVLAAHALGIVNGVGAGLFAPRQGITRQEAAAMLARTAVLIGEIPPVAGPLSFADQAQIAPWARESVFAVSLALVDSTNNMPVMTGISATLFSPLGVYTREQAIITAKRLYNAISASSSGSSSGAFLLPFRFTALDLYGNTVTEASLGEKELFFVHFWATWCGPCVNEMPDLASIAQRYGDRVGFIALLDDYNTGRSAAIRITESAGVTFLNVDARLSDLQPLYRLVQSGYVPTTVLIGRDGSVIGGQIIGSPRGGYDSYIDAALSQ